MQVLKIFTFIYTKNYAFEKVEPTHLNQFYNKENFKNFQT